jgi:hypothetical protein
MTHPHRLDRQHAGIMNFPLLAACRKGLYRLALLALLLSALPVAAAQPGPSAAAPEATEQSAGPPANGETGPAQPEQSCFDRVWHDAHDSPWYLDAKGRRIVPEVTHDWLVVQFRRPEEIAASAEQAQGEPVQAEFTPSAESPAAGFNARFADLFDYRLEMPGEESRSLYRVRPGLPYGAFEALLKRLREAPEVYHVLPVWRIEGKLHAPLNEVEVTWKTVVTPQEREALLQEAGAVAPKNAERQATETVRIDPCRRAAWQASVLLAEDLRVLRAVPRLLEIRPPVAVTFLPDINGAMAGTPIPFRLEIRFGDGITIESATLANLDLKPAGIFQNLYEVHFDQPLSGIDLTRSPITVTGRLLVYATGEFVIPSVPVYYTDSRIDSRTIRAAKTPSTPIRIGAIVPETTGAYRLKVAEPAPPASLVLSGIADRLQRAVLLTAAGLLLLALAVVGWLQLRSRLARSKENGNRLRRRQSREALVRWLKRDPAVMKMDDYAAFGAALRDYLAESAGLGVNARGGSHASFVHNLESRLPKAALSQAEKVLREIDHLLAGEGTSAESGRRLLDRTGELLNSLESASADQGG